MKADLSDKSKLSWQDYGPDDRFNYPIGYGGALLGHDGQGHIDLVYRWEPGKYCHFHRRLCEAGVGWRSVNKQTVNSLQIAKRSLVASVYLPIRKRLLQCSKEKANR